MSRKTKTFFLLLLILLVNSLNFKTISANSTEPLRDLRPGWEAITIYEIPHPPGPKCIGENNDFFYLDNLNNVLMKMDEFGIHSEYQTLNSSFSFVDICFQPNNNRLIGLANYGFYILTSSEVIWLNNFTIGESYSTVIVDPTDDSFYCGSLRSGKNITHFDADGNYLSTILTNIQGCSQLVLNNNQSILYYTETYAGSFSSLNLTSMLTDVLKTNIGLPGTEEVIGIGVDDDDDLYYMTADGDNRGFYKYQYGSFNFLMDSKVGMSTLTWSSKLQIFIAAGSFGGCLIGYDPTKTEAELLTNLINSNTIIEKVDGTILYTIDNEIFQIDQFGPTFFTKNPKNNSILNLILDVDDNIFALLGNDSVAINRVNPDGAFEEWFHDEIHEWARSIHYDVLNHDIVLLTENILINESYVYRIPIVNPLNYDKIATFSNSTKIKATTDIFGNIYIYEAYNNTLFKIPNNSYEREIITTSFVDFSDIYGTHLIVEPPIVYCSIENGIIIGRNDDLQIWLLNENNRTTLGRNNRGIDNSAMYQNLNQEILVTQSTLILRLLYEEPIISEYSNYGLAIIFSIIFVIIIINRKKQDISF